MSIENKGQKEEDMMKSQLRYSVRLVLFVAALGIMAASVANAQRPVYKECWKNGGGGWSCVWILN